MSCVVVVVVVVVGGGGSRCTRSGEMMKGGGWSGKLEWEGARQVLLDNTAECDRGQSQFPKNSGPAQGVSVGPVITASTIEDRPSTCS